MKKKARRRKRKSGRESRQPQGPTPLDVLSTGPIAVPGNPPSCGEVTAIPTQGKDAHLGAIAYLAVLAYPDRKEWSKRDGFMKASKALLLKAAIKKGYPRKKIPREYSGFKKDAIKGTLRQGFRRINDRRMYAAEMARGMLFHNLRVGPFQIETDMPSLNRATIAVAKASGRTSADRKGWAGKFNPDRYPRLDLEKCSMLAKEPPPRTVRRRVWKETLPVLHFAMALLQRWKQLLADDMSETSLFWDPAWLPQAVFIAEPLRIGILPARFPTGERNVPAFDPDRTVQLVPAEGWDTLRASLSHPQQQSA